jgi:uncharacterized protein (UPF0335 family)
MSNISSFLRDFFARIDRLVEERDNINADIKQVKAEAKAIGLDMRVVNRLLSIRKLNEPGEHIDMLHLYHMSLLEPDEEDLT